MGSLGSCTAAALGLWLALGWAPPASAALEEALDPLLTSDPWQTLQILGADPKPTISVPSLKKAWRPVPEPDLMPGFRTVSRGASIEFQERQSGLALRVGQIWLPTGPDSGVRPYYLVFDQRPAAVLSLASEREMGVQASYKPLRELGFTVGAFNNKGSYQVGKLPVKDTITRVDVDLGIARAGGFFYYGTGRWLGDKMRAGFDTSFKVGPIDLTAQVLQGTTQGIRQFGWYAAASQQILRGTTLVARVDQFNSNLGAVADPDSRLVTAVVHRLSATRTVKLNYEVGLVEPIKSPRTHIVVGQLTQVF